MSGFAALFAPGNQVKMFICKNGFQSIRLSYQLTQHFFKRYNLQPKIVKDLFYTKIYPVKTAFDFVFLIFADETTANKLLIQTVYLAL